MQQRGRLQSWVQLCPVKHRLLMPHQLLHKALRRRPRGPSQRASYKAARSQTSSVMGEHQCNRDLGR